MKTCFGCKYWNVFVNKEGRADSNCAAQEKEYKKHYEISTKLDDLLQYFYEEDFENIKGVDCTKFEEKKKG